MRLWIIAVLAAMALPALAAGVVPTADTASVQPLSAVARFDLPAVDRSAALAEDDLRAAQDLPPRFALPGEVDLSPENSGTWEELPDGETLLWRLRATAPGALSLNLGCDRFRLPKGARLVLYPAQGRETAREFTALDNREDDQLWTPVVLGDDLVIELTLPAAVAPRLRAAHREPSTPATASSARLPTRPAPATSTWSAPKGTPGATRSTRTASTP